MANITAKSDRFAGLEMPIRLPTLSHAVWRHSTYFSTIIDAKVKGKREIANIAVRGSSPHRITTDNHGIGQIDDNRKNN